ncbi:MAG: ABC transporter ATP-binding protein [Deltaproteobacteria bacterium]|jgi:phospholipid/cholesterol/gamma-HCH transport system ATP-binding protein|nr:ABC transporter ATP-binding protein [Deltaproteobacteria bacterium]
MENSSIIELVNVHKSFNGQKVLNGLHLAIEDGQITVIIGQSGGGKSVLLKHMIGLIRPDQGEVLFEGLDTCCLSDRQLNEVRKNFGMLFQNAALFDSMTVGENVAFPLREHTKLKQHEIVQIVEHKLSQVGLKDVAHKMPSELSGGMQKRVGLARALALEPKIILFDEPTTGLDPITADAIDRLIVDTQKQTNATYVVISHDIESTFKIADTVAMLYHGRIAEIGKPDAIKSSKNLALQQFIEGKADGPIQVV